MIGVLSYTVILTYLGMISGVTGITLCATGNPVGGVICLVICGFCDMFDGKIARTKKNRTVTEKQFGIQIDSLSDLICFGVLPAMIGYACGLNQWYFIPFMAIYILCALIRLAHYNVTEEVQQQNELKRTYYEGLPVTNATLIFTVLYAVSFFVKSQTIYSYIYAGMLFLVACLFVMKVKIVKVKTVGAVILFLIGLASFIFVCVAKFYIYK